VRYCSGACPECVPEGLRECGPGLAADRRELGRRPRVTGIFVHGLQRGMQARVCGRPIPAGGGCAPAEIAAEGNDEQHVEQTIQHGLLPRLHGRELAG
jgi:hypothetical protein